MNGRNSGLESITDGEPVGGEADGARSSFDELCATLATLCSSSGVDDPEVEGAGIFALFGDRPRRPHRSKIRGGRPTRLAKQVGRAAFEVARQRAEAASAERRSRAASAPGARRVRRSRRGRPGRRGSRHRRATGAAPWPGTGRPAAARQLGSASST